MHLVPQTIANELDQQITNLLGKTNRYLPKDNEEIVSLFRQCEKLAGKDAATAAILRVRLCTATGDRETGEYWAKNARRLHASLMSLNCALSLLYANLGYFVEANEPVKFIANPENGLASLVINNPVGHGALHLAQDMSDRAKAMNIENVKLPPFVSEAVAAMDLWGDSDNDYLAALDVAGSVMRDNRLLPATNGLVVGIIHSHNGDLPTVKLEMEVDTDLDGAIELTVDYVMRLSASGIKIPPSLSFEFTPNRSLEADSATVLDIAHAD